MNFTRHVLLLLLLYLAGGCARWPGPIGESRAPSPTTTAQWPSTSPDAVTAPTATPPPIARWDVYDPDPGHLWNRMFRHFYGRTSPDGAEVGWDSLDPLLWYETTHLLEGPSYPVAIALLDEFLATRGDRLIGDPVRRAMFQRDLWAVFDWTTLREDTHPEERRELQRRLALVIRRLALPRQDILSLPNNFASTVISGAFPTAFRTDRPEEPFLPAGLLAPDGEWGLLGRQGGPFAMSHTESFPFFGRSVFLVLLRAPGDSSAFVERLNDERGLPSLASMDLTGVEVALVRRALLIDDRGSLILSPLVESVQLRHYAPLQQFYEFQLDRAALLAGHAAGLRPVTEDFALFFGHGIDPFESGFDAVSLLPETCRGCHGGEVYGVQSILSYSRFRFDLPGGEEPYLTLTTMDQEAASVISGKVRDRTWGILKSFWD